MTIDADHVTIFLAGFIAGIVITELIKYLSTH